MRRSKARLQGNSLSRLGYQNKPRYALEMCPIIGNQRNRVAHGEGSNPEIIIRQDLAALVQLVLQVGICGRRLVVKRENEGCLQAALEFRSSLFPPASPQGSEEQFTYGNEGKRCDATLHVAEIRLAAWITRHHQIREHICIKKDNA